MYTVYVLRDEQGQPLYIGISSRGIDRVLQHWDKEWWPRVKSATIEHYPTKQAALDRETELIHSYPRLENINKNSTALAKRPVRLRGARHKAVEILNPGAVDQIRRRMGLRHLDLAQRSGLSRGFITQILSGSRNASPQAIQALSKALECEVDEIVTVGRLSPRRGVRSSADNPPQTEVPLLLTSPLTSGFVLSDSSGRVRGEKLA